MAKVGLPEPHALWIAYAASEFILPPIVVVAHRRAGISSRKKVIPAAKTGLIFHAPCSQRGAI